MTRVLAHAQTSYPEPRKPHLRRPLCALDAEIGLRAALHDAEERLVVATVHIEGAP
jgi:hypothetical protein